MKADRRTEAAVMAVVNGWFQGYAARDIDGILETLARDPDVFMFGTRADEILTGFDEIKAQAERDWSQTEALAFELEWYSISAAGPVAWLAGGITIRGRAGGQDLLLPGSRLTLVLEQRGDQWLVVHAHFSLPADGQAEGESMPAESS